LLVQIANGPWVPDDPERRQPPLAGVRAARGGSATVVDTSRVTVRPARISDMRAVEPIIRNFANDRLMLPKSSDQLARTFREFVVATDGDEIIGCGALRIYTEKLAEICSLAVAEPYQGGGVGRKLVARLLDEARALDLETVFALTLQPVFFEKLGFRTVSKENFPLKVWADCRTCPKLYACDEIAVAVEV
jgi:amino-acid N-acetyltransferase